MKLAFVILNYGTYKETTECVLSIMEHIDVDDYNITIVDNGSSDNSLEQFREKYFDNEKIDILSTDKNLGFAKGNNIGIEYVNEEYSPDFVVVMNSDTEIFQDDLYYKIITEYEKSHFGVLGPMMLVGSGKCDDSPWIPMTLTQMEGQLKHLEREYRFLKVFPYNIYKIKNKIHSFFKDNVDELHFHGNFWQYQVGVELQGAFLIFSKEIFKYIEGFDPRTFLYYEEQLLYLAVKKSGMKMVYDPKIAVYHKDGISTKKTKSTKQKMLFLKKCAIDSLRVVISEMINERS